jgi:HEAT repeat protein
MTLDTLLKTPPWEWPGEAGKLILKTLVDRDAKESDRLSAAELGGELVVMNDDLAEALLAIVASAQESVDLRAAAASSLGPVLEDADLNQIDEPDDVPIAERTFDSICDTLHNLYLDKTQPKQVRRSVLEAAVRSPQVWHADAIRTAYSSGDSEWMLTAVFAMRWVPGFDDQILEALKSSDPLIHYQAVKAAGSRELDAAWPHVVALVKAASTPKVVRLAAIEAVGKIRPAAAIEILEPLLDSRDEDIAEAADEAVAMARALSAEPDDEDDSASDSEDDSEDEADGKKWVN